MESLDETIATLNADVANQKKQLAQVAKGERDYVDAISDEFLKVLQGQAETSKAEVKIYADNAEHLVEQASEKGDTAMSKEKKTIFEVGKQWAETGEARGGERFAPPSGGDNHKSGYLGINTYKARFFGGKKARNLPDEAP